VPRAHTAHTARLAAPQVSRDDLPAIFQKYGDDEFVMDLLEEFVREANTSLAVIETKDDARAVQSAAHRIKGSAGNLDLHSIRQIAEVVEVNAVSDGVEWPYRGGDGGGADEGDGEFDAVVRAAAPLLPRRAPAPCPPPAAHTPPRPPQVLLLKARVKRVADLLQLGAEQLKAGATDSASSATSSGKSSMASTD
jgi:HPt (histidine-containing phosphotransfer) domain-containing protein